MLTLRLRQVASERGIRLIPNNLRGDKYNTIREHKKYFQKKEDRSEDNPRTLRLQKLLLVPPLIRPPCTFISLTPKPYPPNNAKNWRKLEKSEPCSVIKSPN